MSRNATFSRNGDPRCGVEIIITLIVEHIAPDSPSGVWKADVLDQRCDCYDYADTGWCEHLEDLHRGGERDEQS